MLKVGMVGVGCISGIYLKNFAEVFRDVKLVAVCDLIRERAENAQKQYNIPKLYDTMHELFADPEVSKAALLAGKHVYSEKPLGADLEEGIELVKLAEEKGLVIGGAPDTFLGAGIQTCRRLIDSGIIGDIIGGIVFPTGGAYFPGFTLSAIVVGLIPGLGKKIAGKRILKPWMIIFIVIITEIISSIFMNSLWISMMAGTPFWASFAARAPFSAIKAVVYGFITAPLYKTLRSRDGLWN